MRSGSPFERSNAQGGVQTKSCLNTWLKTGVQTFEQLAQKRCSNGVQTVFKRYSNGDAHRSCCAGTRDAAREGCWQIFEGVLPEFCKRRVNNVIWCTTPQNKSNWEEILSRFAGQTSVHPHVHTCSHSVQRCSNAQSGVQTLFKHHLCRTV